MRKDGKRVVVSPGALNGNNTPTPTAAPVVYVVELSKVKAGENKPPAPAVPPPVVADTSREDIINRLQGGGGAAMLPPNVANEMAQQAGGSVTNEFQEFLRMKQQAQAASPLQITNGPITPGVAAQTIGYDHTGQPILAPAMGAANMNAQTMNNAANVAVGSALAGTQIQAATTAAQIQLQSQQNTMAQQQAQIQAATNQQAQAQMANLQQQQFQQMQNALQQAQNQMQTELTNRINALQESSGTAAVHQTLLTLTSQQNQLNDQVQTLLSRMQTVGLKVENIEGHRLFKESTGTMSGIALTSSISKIISDNDQYKVEMQEKEDKIQSLKEKIADLRKKNELYIKESNQLIDDKKNALTTASESRLDMDREISRLKEELARSNNERDDGQRHLVTVKKLLELSDDELKKTKQTLEKLDTSSQSDQERIHELTKALREEKNNRKAAQERCTHLREELNEEKEAKLRIESQLEDKKRRGDSERAHYQELLEQERSNAEEEAARVKQNMQEAIKTKEKRWENDKLQTQEEYFERGREEGRALGRDEASQTLKATMENLNIKITNQQTEIGVLQRNCEEFKTALEKVNEELTVTQDKLKVEQNDRAAAQKKVAETNATKEKEIQGMEEKMASSIEEEKSKVKGIMSKVFFNMDKAMKTDKATCGGVKIRRKEALDQLMGVIKQVTVQALNDTLDDDEEDDDDEPYDDSGDDDDSPPKPPPKPDMKSVEVMTDAAAVTLVVDTHVPTEEHLDRGLPTIEPSKRSKSGKSAGSSSSSTTSEDRDASMDMEVTSTVARSFVSSVDDQDAGSTHLDGQEGDEAEAFGGDIHSMVPDVEVGSSVDHRSLGEMDDVVEGGEDAGSNFDLTSPITPAPPLTDDSAKTATPATNPPRGTTVDLLGDAGEPENKESPQEESKEAEEKKDSGKVDLLASDDEDAAQAPAETPAEEKKEEEGEAKKPAVNLLDDTDDETAAAPEPEEKKEEDKKAPAVNLMADTDAEEETAPLPVEEEKKPEPKKLGAFFSEDEEDEQEPTPVAAAAAPKTSDPTKLFDETETEAEDIFSAPGTSSMPTPLEKKEEEQDKTVDPGEDDPLGEGKPEGDNIFSYSDDEGLGSPLASVQKAKEEEKAPEPPKMKGSLFETEDEGDGELPLPVPPPKEATSDAPPPPPVAEEKKEEPKEEEKEEEKPEEKAAPPVRGGLFETDDEGLSSAPEAPAPIPTTSAPIRGGLLITDDEGTATEPELPPAVPEPKQDEKKKAENLFAASDDEEEPAPTQPPPAAKTPAGGVNLFPDSEDEEDSTPAPKKDEPKTTAPATTQNLLESSGDEEEKAPEPPKPKPKPAPKGGLFDASSDEEEEILPPPKPKPKSAPPPSGNLFGDSSESEEESPFSTNRPKAAAAKPKPKPKASSLFEDSSDEDAGFNPLA
eukprot:TRINITY_DN54768_c0_g1_i1.p1 TRINITY_DN54768_c0_g1~~TRINITY_DN54768_c0_g1_i1.p1  ORF type:complete len:1614 (+),score=449.92 TRINITY_DN54768_c0_g1_i1:600-4844(+)